MASLRQQAQRTQRMIAKGIAWGGPPADPAQRAQLRERWVKAQEVIDNG